MPMIYLKSDKLLPEMKDLRFEVFCIEQGIDEKLEIEDNEDSYFHLGIYENQLLIAYCRIPKTADGHIYRVLVRKEFRNKGYGSKIIEYAESFVKQAQDFAILGAQQQAVPFYSKLGYIIISDQYLDAGIPHYTMRKNLI